ncbi:hypothetical protein [Pareuzebyella sediminis]|uniref:hypothetical protein n=1 Tax=Pareuzebyella sediminis TaxID=2607998 RepID=UPI0011ED5596|nr:hypothetical protein [Pareuzebyella sediminis]
MKTSQISSISIAIFFIISTILQSCVAYKNKPVSLAEAERSKKRVKIKTNSNRTYRFEQIVSDEERFYGLIKENGEMAKIEIRDYKEAFLQSKSKSTWSTIAVIAVPTITAVIIGVNQHKNFTLNSGFDLGL